MNKYLLGYPSQLLGQVSQLIAQGRLGETLRRRYPEAHDVRTDHALYDYVPALKSRFLAQCPSVVDPNLSCANLDSSPKSGRSRSPRGSTSLHGAASHNRVHVTCPIAQSLRLLRNRSAGVEGRVRSRLGMLAAFAMFALLYEFS